MLFKPVQYANWHQVFENMSVSPLEVYKSLELTLAAQKIPDINFSRMELLQGGVLSDKRTYLKLQRDWLTYHICVAPFGTGFFVSSRLLIWPWESWPIVAVCGGVMVFSLLGITGLVASMTNTPTCGLLIGLFFTFPMVILFGLIVLVWAYMCQHVTYYRQDTMLAFQDVVHRALVAEINRVVEGSGRKPLSDAESKPILHKLLQR